MRVIVFVTLMALAGSAATAWASDEKQVHPAEDETPNAFAPDCAKIKVDKEGRFICPCCQCSQQKPKNGWYKPVLTPSPLDHPERIMAM